MASTNYRIKLSESKIDWNKINGIFQNQIKKAPIDQIHDFELAIANYVSCPNVLALNSGTAALHLALRTLNIGMGDYVICSTFTFVASANPILYLGANPIFVDSESTTWNMDPDLLKKAISESISSGVKPKAIIVAHIYGVPAKISEIMEIANSYEIPLIEDAAEAFGATYENQMAGTFGTLGVFSFNTNKTFTTMGGGALVSKNEVLIEYARFLSTQAKAKRHYYYHTDLGYNYSINPWGASLGFSQISSVDEFVQKRRNIFDFYHRNLQELSDLTVLQEPAKCVSSRWLTAILINKIETGKSAIFLKETILKNAKAHKIEFRSLWKPLHKQPIYSNCRTFLNGFSEDLFTNGICLPSSNHLTNDQLQLVVEVLTLN